MLTISQLHAGYDGVEVLHGLSLHVAPRTITALIGSNGAGKTTLLRTVLGLLPVRAGRIEFEGHSIAALAVHERVRAGMAMSPEGRLVFPSMSVDENLRLGAVASTASGEVSARHDRVMTLFPRLMERRRQAAGCMSGGEQQMLAVGRALMSAPRLLLLDEPTLGLAPVMADHIFKSMDQLRTEGMTILVAEQDTRRTLDLANHAFVIENGAVAFEGSGTHLLEDERVRTAFLGI